MVFSLHISGLGPCHGLDLTKVYESGILYNASQFRFVICFSQG